MEEAQAQVEGGSMSAFSVAWGLVKEEPMCENCVDKPAMRGSDFCRSCAMRMTGVSYDEMTERQKGMFRRSDDKSEEKGKFRGYSKNTISGRSERQGKARAWNQSRRNKRRRTRNIYARQKGRGNVRPAMRRQLGAGASRAETKR